MTVPDVADEIIVGPDDFLVLVCKESFASAEDVDHLRDQIPEKVRSRVLVVSAQEFDVHVVRGKTDVA